MDLELKKVNFYEAFSEETNAFTAEIYYKGKKVGEAKNDGQGGSTHVYSLPNTKDAFKQAKQYALGLPPFEIKSNFTDNGTFTITSDLETQVDDLFEKWLTINLYKKYFNKGLVYKDGDDNVQVVGWGSNNTISKMLKSNAGIEAIQVTANRLEKEGCVILNTNLEGII